MVMYESWKKESFSIYDRINMKFNDAKKILESINKTVSVESVLYRRDGLSYIVYIKTNYPHDLSYTFKFTRKQFIKVKDLLVECNGGNDLVESIY